VEGAIDGSKVVVDMLLSFTTILATGNEVVRRVIEDLLHVGDENINYPSPMVKGNKRYRSAN